MKCVLIENCAIRQRHVGTYVYAFNFFSLGHRQEKLDFLLGINFMLQFLLEQGEHGNNETCKE